MEEKFSIVYILSWFAKNWSSISGRKETEEMDPVDTFENNMSEGSTSAVGVSRNRTVIRGHVQFHDSSKQNVRERYTLQKNIDD